MPFFKRNEKHQLNPNYLIGTTNQLPPTIRKFALNYFHKIELMLPRRLRLVPDMREKQAEPLEKPDELSEMSLSLEDLTTHQRVKYGTARVSLKGKCFFVKMVARSVPISFLHQRRVYDLIRMYYPNCTISRSQSQTARGFALQNRSSVITLEVFEKDGEGNLACDMMLEERKESIACEKMAHFLEFYGCICNLLGREEMQFELPKQPKLGEAEYIPNRYLEKSMIEHALGSH